MSHWTNKKETKWREGWGLFDTLEQSSLAQNSSGTSTSLKSGTDSPWDSPNYIGMFGRSASGSVFFKLPALDDSA